MPVKPAVRTALVTGAARRVGAAIARDLAAAGWRVALHTNLSFDAGERLAAEFAAAGVPTVALKADLADLATLAPLLDAAIAALGPIDLLVNNASEFEPDAVGALDAERFERHLRVDLVSPCLLADLWAQRLPADMEGHVVNVIDQRVLHPNPHYFSYTLAKSALWTATRTMAQALAPRIRVNAVAPGPAFRNSRQTPESFAAEAAAVPLGRGPMPEEFGRTVRFLAETPSITGQTICLDGGQHLAWQTPDVLAGEG